MNTVQVTTDAKASPIMTACTTMSAFMNIDHGDNSCSVAALLSGRAPSVAAAVPSGDIGSGGCD